MKKLIPLLGILFLLSYGCSDNKDQRSGFERQEEGHGQTPGFEKEQYRLNDANITTPVDSRPDLEEED